MKKTCYLGGPITGLTLEEARAWRRRFASRLQPEIKAIDPFAGESDEYLSYGAINSHEPGRLMSDAAALVVKDRFFVKRSDVVYMRFLGATAISKMSIGELFWADAWGKPLVIAIEPAGNPNDDARIRTMTPWVVDNDEDAEMVIRSLLEAV
jgi:hypothetical protein